MEKASDRLENFSFARSWNDDPNKRPQMSEIVVVLRAIRSWIIDAGVISSPVMIPPLPPDYEFSPLNTSDEAWEEENEKDELGVETPISQEFPMSQVG